MNAMRVNKSEHFLVNSKCNAIVRWRGSLARSFAINAGVRQGGVFCLRISLQFRAYIDYLTRTLETCGHGCVIHGVFLGCIVHADDIFLI